MFPGFLASAARDVGVDGAALDRAGPDEGDFDDEVVELPRPQFPLHDKPCHPIGVVVGDVPPRVDHDQVGLPPRRLFEGDLQGTLAQRAAVEPHHDRPLGRIRGGVLPAPHDHYGAVSVTDDRRRCRTDRHFPEEALPGAADDHHRRRPRRVDQGGYRRIRRHPRVHVHSRCHRVRLSDGLLQNALTFLGEDVVPRCGARQSSPVSQLVDTQCVHDQHLQQSFLGDGGGPSDGRPSRLRPVHPDDDLPVRRVHRSSS
ncbi:hypothetical protein SAMN04489731_1133 [Amycolatopsis regifaucium]|nr:hypothetical protein SAMN04489731_1133 [Amycolatopsis regifaucium]